jgi:hypothetical protein
VKLEQKFYFVKGLNWGEFALERLAPNPPNSPLPEGTLANLRGKGELRSRAKSISGIVGV